MRPFLPRKISSGQMTLPGTKIVLSATEADSSAQPFERSYRGYFSRKMFSGRGMFLVAVPEGLCGERSGLRVLFLVNEALLRLYLKTAAHAGTKVELNPESADAAVRFSLLVPEGAAPERQWSPSGKLLLNYCLSQAVLAAFGSLS